MKKLVSLVVVMLITVSLYAQQQNVPADLLADSSGQSGGLTHLQVVLPAAISASFTAAGIVEDGLFSANPPDSAYWIETGTLFAATLPVYFVNLPIGITLSGISVGLNVATNALASYGDGSLSSLLGTGILDDALFSAYAAYRDARVRAEPGIYSEGWRQNPISSFFFEGDAELGYAGSAYSWKAQSALDLALSPFQYENYSDPLVWLSPVSAAITDLVVQFINGQSQAVWTTGSAYIGTSQFTPALGVPLAGAALLAQVLVVAITEESYFRGFVHEELGSSFGWLPAYTAEPLFFAAYHIPTDLYTAGDDWLTTADNFVGRTLLAFILDLDYDHGGLSRSVAAHFWLDFPQLFINYLFHAGVPYSDWWSQLLSTEGLSVGIRINI